MTQRLSHRIAALTMACMMLLTSTGLSMDMHFCQNELKGISILGKARSCHEKQKAPPCHKMQKACHHTTGDTQAEKDDCCKNKTLVIEQSDFDALPVATEVSHDIVLPFVVAYVQVFVVPTFTPAELPHYLQDKPPRSGPDLQVLYQTFLI